MHPSRVHAQSSQNALIWREYSSGGSVPTLVAKPKLTQLTHFLSFASLFFLYRDRDQIFHPHHYQNR